MCWLGCCLGIFGPNWGLGANRVGPAVRLRRTRQGAVKHEPAAPPPSLPAGDAGTGKSFLLNRIVEWLREQYEEDFSTAVSAALWGVAAAVFWPSVTRAVARPRANAPHVAVPRRRHRWP